MTAYRYLASPHCRRHGPTGYTDLESFRPWLRDEFSFRCVYCLERETWSNLVAAFEIDHFLPVSLHPDKSLDYDNLLYACRACNAVKRQLRVRDPLKVLLSDSVIANGDGRLEVKARADRRLVDLMDLNRPAYVERRRFILRMVQTAGTHDRLLYRMLLGFPDDLPDLTRLRPAMNVKPKGIGQSFLSQRQRGVLPDGY